jgi:hypothetical protein
MEYSQSGYNHQYTNLFQKLQKQYRLTSSWLFLRTVSSLTKRYCIQQRDVKPTNSNERSAILGLKSTAAISDTLAASAPGFAENVLVKRSNPRSQAHSIPYWKCHNQHWTYAKEQHDNNFQLLYPQRRADSKKYWPILVKDAVTGIHINTDFLYSSDSQ